MKTKSSTVAAAVISGLLLTGCQTTNITSSKDTPQFGNISTLIPDIPDSDGDGIFDDIDECPGTPINVMTDDKGCPPSLLLENHFKMEYRAFFANASSELSPEYQLELDKVAQKLQEYNTATMVIEGHASTDEISDTVLQPDSLSRNRALIVKNYLIMQHQIDPNRLSISSYGAKQPIASSDTEEGKSLNRRVYGIAEKPLE